MQSIALTRPICSLSDAEMVLWFFDFTVSISIQSLIQKSFVFTQFKPLRGG